MQEEVSVVQRVLYRRFHSMHDPMLIMPMLPMLKTGGSKVCTLNWSKLAAATSKL